MKSKTNRALQPLRPYLTSIDQYPLLTAEQERELAARIQKGDYEAREHMVAANLRLVVNIAKGFLGRGSDIEDLISEGNLGLIRAAEDFDPTKNVRFGTYAGHWIKQSIRRSTMNGNSPIRLPSYMINLISKWRQASITLSDQLGRQATPKEIGDHLQIPRKKISVITKAIKLNNMTRTEIDLDSDLDCVAPLELRTRDLDCVAPLELAPPKLRSA